MPEYLENRRLDDQLANFTDRLLNHESGDKLQLSDQDETLEKLQRTIVQLKYAGGVEAQPDPEFSAHLHAILLEEWRKMEAARKVNPAKGQCFLQSLSQQFKDLFSVKRSQTLSLRFGIVAIGVLLLLLLVLPLDNGAITASAGLGSLGWPVIVGLGILCIGIIWFLLRKGKG